MNLNASHTSYNPEMAHYWNALVSYYVNTAHAMSLLLWIACELVVIIMLS